MLVARAIRRDRPPASLGVGQLAGSRAMSARMFVNGKSLMMSAGEMVAHT
jgi:hypothetical protein